MLFLVLCVLCAFVPSHGQDVYLLRKVKDCLGQETALICLKEQALDLLNQTVSTDRIFNLYGIEVVKDPKYVMDVSNDLVLPRDLNQKTSRLNELLLEKLTEFFASRSLRINLSNIVEGRAKKDKKGSMMVMGGIAMAGMLAQLIMGKLAMMAGAALLISKVALMLSTIIGLKKLTNGGGGGGESSHVVYATPSEGYGGHGHGGWHRSLADDETQNGPYRQPTNEYVENY